MHRTGSEKYPDENAYDAFLSNHGGSSNPETGVLRLSRFSRDSDRANDEKSSPT